MGNCSDYYGKQFKGRLLRQYQILVAGDQGANVA